MTNSRPRARPNPPFKSWTSSWNKFFGYARAALQDTVPTASIEYATVVSAVLELDPITANWGTNTNQTELGNIALTWTPAPVPSEIVIVLSLSQWTRIQYIAAESIRFAVISRVDINGRPIAISTDMSDDHYYTDNIMLRLPDTGSALLSVKMFLNRSAPPVNMTYEQRTLPSSSSLNTLGYYV